MIAHQRTLALQTLHEPRRTDDGDASSASSINFGTVRFLNRRPTLALLTAKRYCLQEFTHPCHQQCDAVNDKVTQEFATQFRHSFLSFVALFCTHSVTRAQESVTAAVNFKPKVSRAAVTHPLFQKFPLWSG
jgi:hypothetical protein